MSALQHKRIRLDYGRDGGWDQDVEWRFPVISPRFQSPLVNETNWAYSGRSGDLVERVALGKKPLAFEERSELNAQRRLLDLALRNGCAAKLQPVDLSAGVVWFLSAAVPGRVRELFDLEALLADYRDYTAALGAQVYEDIALEIERIRHHHVGDFLNFADVEVEFISVLPTKRRPGSLARCGLLLGYPVETTAALICGDWGLRECGWFDVAADGRLVRNH